MARIAVLGLILALLSFVTNSYAASENRRCEEGSIKREDMLCEVFNKQAEANSELEALIAELKAKTKSDESKTSFDLTEEAWKKFVARSCSYEGVSWLGGRELAIGEVACKARYTKLRSQQIKGYLACKGNDCPFNW